MASVERTEPLPISKGMRSLRIRIATWNHHKRLPVGDLSELLGQSQEVEAEYDIIVIGGQECPTGVDSRDDHRKWSDILKDHYCGVREKIDTNQCQLGRDYQEEDLTDEESSRKGDSAKRYVRRGLFKPLVKARLMGIYLAVLCHKSLIRKVKNVRTDIVKTGALHGTIGNKGAVAIAFEIEGIRMLFISVHLSPHQTMIRPRLKNMAKILRHLHIGEKDGPDHSPSKTYGFAIPDPVTSDNASSDSDEASESSVSESPDSPSMTRIIKETRLDLFNDIDAVFLFGDLNFRVDLSRNYVEEQVLKGEFAALMKADQLRNLLDGEASNVFKLFEEPVIDFAPTYKYDTISRLRKNESRHGKNKNQAASGDQDQSSGNVKGNDAKSKPSLAVPQGIEGEGIRRTASPTPIDTAVANVTTNNVSIKSLSLDSPITRQSDSASTGSPESEFVASPPSAHSLPTKGPFTDPSRTDSLVRSYDSSSKKRGPSWTDRILFHARGTGSRLENPAVDDGKPELSKGDVRCLFYRSVTSDFGARSDHQPVIGAYEVQI